MHRFNGQLTANSDVIVVVLSVLMIIKKEKRKKERYKFKLSKCESHWRLRRLAKIVSIRKYLTINKCQFTAKTIIV